MVRLAAKPAGVCGFRSERAGGFVVDAVALTGVDEPAVDTGVVAPVCDSERADYCAGVDGVTNHDRQSIGIPHHSIITAENQRFRAA